MLGAVERCELGPAEPEAASGTSCETAPVFRHDHRGEDVAERIDHLMAAVFVDDDAPDVPLFVQRPEGPAFHGADPVLHSLPREAEVAVVDLDRAGPAQRGDVPGAAVGGERLA